MAKEPEVLHLPIDNSKWIDSMGQATWILEDGQEIRSFQLRKCFMSKTGYVKIIEIKSVSLNGLNVEVVASYMETELN